MPTVMPPKPSSTTHYYGIRISVSQEKGWANTSEGKGMNARLTNICLKTVLTSSDLQIIGDQGKMHCADNSKSILKVHLSTWNGWSY